MGGLIALLLGLIFGSFGSVILSRWGNEYTRKSAGSILWGRSECPYCKHVLKAWDLVPLFSFIFQKGKCRYCRKKIARLYPVLELGSALIFSLIFYYQKDASFAMLAFWMINAWILWLLLVYDVLWYEVHLPLLIFGILFSLLFMLFDIVPWLGLQGGGIFLALFLVLYIAAKGWVYAKYHTNEEGMGFGDVCVAPYLGILLFVGASNYVGGIETVFIILLFLIISGMIGIFRFFIQNKRYGKQAKFLNKKMADQSLPFLPAMILALALLLCFQESLFSLAI